MSKVNHKIDCNSDIAKRAVIKIEGSLSLFLAMIQALQFSLENKNLFMNKYPCEDCYQALQFLQGRIYHLIQESVDSEYKRAKLEDMN